MRTARQQLDRELEIVETHLTAIRQQQQQLEESYIKWTKERLKLLSQIKALNENKAITEVKE